MLFSQELIKNINPSNGDGIDNFQKDSFIINDKLFFGATENTNNELWVLYMSTNQAHKVLTTGNLTIKPSFKMAVFNDKIIVVDLNGKVWLVSDENPANNLLLFQLSSTQYANSSFNSKNFITIGNKCFFEIYTANQGTELMCTDGTPAGTYLLDLVSGSDGSYPINFTSFQGKLFFSIHTSSKTQLYSSDGTPTGTIMIKEYPNLPARTVITNLIPYGNTLYFTAMEANSSGSFINNLYSTDGTVNNTTLKISDFTAEDSFVLNGSFYISSYNKTYKLVNNNFILATSDGTIASGQRYLNTSNEIIFSYQTSYRGYIKKFNGTSVQNLFPSSANDFRLYTRKVNDNELIIVYASYTSNTYKSELWKMNLNTLVFTKLLDLVPVVNSTIGYKSQLIKNEGNIISLNGKYYFINNDYVNGYSLWETDLTPQGTIKIQSLGGMNTDETIDPDWGVFRKMELVDNKLYFNKNNLPTKERTLVLYNPVNNQTQSLSEFVTNDEVIKHQALNNTDSKIFFYASNLSNGRELWRYENDLSSLVKDINTTNSGNQSSNPDNFVRVANTVFFTANDGLHGKELWKTDGTTAGTTMFFNFTPIYSVTGISGFPSDKTGSFFNGFKAFDNKLYLIVNGSELWMTDGENQPQMVFQFPISTYTNKETTCEFVEMQNSLFFMFSGSLWKLQNNIVTKIKDLGGSTTWNPIFVFNNKIYMCTQTQATNLWVSDGTTSGTTLIGNHQVLNFVDFNNNVYFATQYGIYKISASNVISTYYSAPYGIYQINIPNENNLIFRKGIFRNNSNLFFWSYKNFYGSSYKAYYEGTANYATEIGEDVGGIDNAWTTNMHIYFFNSGSLYRRTNTSKELVSTNVYTHLGLDGTRYLHWGKINIYDENTNSITTIAQNDTYNYNYSNLQTLTTFKDYVIYSPLTVQYGRELWQINKKCKQNVVLINPNHNATNGLNYVVKVNQTINATNLIKDTSIINFKAGQSIELMPGFESKTGTIFKAEIEGCICCTPILGQGL